MRLKGLIFGAAIALSSTAIVMGISSCGTDILVDPAGECVTCTYAATAATAERVIMACADGDGNITVTETGQEPVVSERLLIDFRLPHESSGATCR